MKARLIGAMLLIGSGSALADAPGGPNCGWGNMLLEGKTGLVNHMLALTTNGTSGNATFGMTFGTNGCSVEGPLTYGGESMVWFNGILDEYSTDVALGHGEALNAVAVMIGVAPEDRTHFNAVMHENFEQLFPSTDTTGQEVLDTMVAVMSEDQLLNKYVG
ncbi:MAG: DUF3015 domain-containing protein [Gammaproteobacteria bacterium]|nr:DUF3015 domain-containing protein [Gammaproteobacteria bacterium]